MKYVDPDGNSLSVFYYKGFYALGWKCRGGFEPEDPIHNELMSGDGGESGILTVALSSFHGTLGLEPPKPRGVFLYDTGNQARKALQAANVALCLWKNAKPIPDWAEKALKAGWKPPKGWSP